jgi:N-acetylneuraminate synthase
MIEAALRAGSDVDSVIATVAENEEQRHAELVSSGYASMAPGIYTRELSSTYWRRGRVFVIAEAGSNWRMGTPRRDQEMAFRLIDAARAAGADAVKFQTFRPDTIYVEGAGSSDYLAGAGIRDSMKEIFTDLAMPYEMLSVLAAHSADQGIAVLAGRLRRRRPPRTGTQDRILRD